jgi:hypothetical protein
MVSADGTSSKDNSAQPAVKAPTPRHRCGGPLMLVATVKEDLMRPTRTLRALVPILTAALLTGLLAPSAPAGPAAAPAAPTGALERYARDTWASFVAMVDQGSQPPPMP